MVRRLSNLKTVMELIDSVIAPPMTALDARLFLQELMDELRVRNDGLRDDIAMQERRRG